MAPGPAPRASITPLFLATAIVTALNAVYFKCMLNSFRGDAEGAGLRHDYAAFVSVFDILLWALFMSGVARVGGWKSSAWTSALEVRRGILRVAAVDQLGTLLATLGAAQVPGQAQVLLNQAVLPLTMLIAMAQGRRYGAGEVLGAALVMSGAIVAVGLASQLSLRTGVFLFSLAQVAVAVAGLGKEALLGQAKARAALGSPGDEAHSAGGEYAPVGDPIALGVAVAWVRVPLGVVLALALRRDAQGGVLAEFRDGWLCFCGEQPRPGDSGCPTAARNTVLSVMLYSAQTLLGLRLTQRGSATFRSIAAVTSVPLAQFFFTSELLMTDAGVEPYGIKSATGLLLCLAGFYLYLSGARRSSQGPAVRKVV